MIQDQGHTLDSSLGSDTLDWPHEISLAAFRRTWQLEGSIVWETVFEMHREKMQIKNVNIAIANLENIFTSTFKLTAEKGFQSMSLRDLSRETGISMGGLYSYIGSKDELASVIEDVLRHYIDKVLGGLSVHELSPARHLQAIVFGETYMNEIMNPWFYFCYMELKGLPRDQQEKAMDLELRFEAMIIDAVQRGVDEGVFRCEDPQMLAIHTVGVLQQWYLKRWKFKRKGIDSNTFAESVFKGLLLNLGYQAEPVELSSEQLQGVRNL
jgi:AcrR family transcriptional regulator